MFRTVKVAAVTTALALALAGCAESRGDDSRSKAVCDSAPGQGLNVGIAYDVGGRGDQSFNDSAARGLKRAVEDLDVSCTELEAALGDPESAREDRLRSLAEGGHDPIISVGFAYSDAANIVAPDYPDVSFAVIDGFDPDEEPNDNVAYLGFAEEQGSFLVGVAAALTTKSDHVGFVGGVHIDLIKKFEAGFAAGVEAVDKKITVDVTYIEETDLKGFNDPAGGKAAATAMYESGADVLYHASGPSGAGVFDAAVDAGDGMWAIGVDSDQFLTANDEAQAHILTSMLKRVDTATFNMIQSVADGEPLTGYQTYDLATDGVGYSTSGDFLSEDTISQIDDFAAQIESGEIEVPTTP